MSNVSPDWLSSAASRAAQQKRQSVASTSRRPRRRTGPSGTRGISSTPKGSCCGLRLEPECRVRLSAASRGRVKGRLSGCRTCRAPAVTGQCVSRSPVSGMTGHVHRLDPGLPVYRVVGDWYARGASRWRRSPAPAPSGVRRPGAYPAGCHGSSPVQGEAEAG